MITAKTSLDLISHFILEVSKMYFSSSTIIAASAFFGLSLALPTSEVLTDREWKDCPAKTSYYVCANNGFKGCCTVDPCALPACPSSDYKSPPINPNTTAPAPPSNPGPVCAPGVHKLYHTSLHTIQPAKPDTEIFSSKNAPLNYFISNSGPGEEDATSEQVAIFSGIPAAAKFCRINWSVAAERSFTVSGNGLTDICTLKNPIPEKITYNSVQAAAGEKVGSADFTNWPQVAGVQDHIVGSVDCSSEMAFKLAISNVGEVLLTPTPDTGFYVQYEC